MPDYRILLVSALLLAPLAARADTHTLHCGHIVDVAAGQRLGEHVIEVDGGEIVAMRAGSPAVDAENVVDLSGLTCLPGLMDMHTHLSSELEKGGYVKRFTLSPAQVTLNAVVYARRTVEAGFTTVRDVGDSYNVTVALREAVADGKVPGPRIFTSAKSLATTGGHADPTNGYRPDLMGRPGPDDGVLNGAAEAREAVRQRYKDGADLIKITATGGVLSLAKSGRNPQFRTEELEAVIATAADYDMHVAAHAHGAEGMKRAIRAGIHSIEHGTFMDDEVIALMKEHGTWYVPTISAGWFVAEKAEEDDYFPAIVRPKAREVGPQIQSTFEKAWRGGVKIAFGTDSGVSPHGDNAKEFVYMTNAGMTPAEALRTATLHAAELLGQSRRLGRLAPGMAADVVAVDGNPLEDVRLLQDVRFVMAAGRSVRAP